MFDIWLYKSVLEQIIEPFSLVEMALHFRWFWGMLWPKGSGEGSLGGAGICGKLQGCVEDLLCWFGTGRLADVDGSSVFALYGGGNADLS